MHLRTQRHPDPATPLQTSTGGTHGVPRSRALRSNGATAQHALVGSSDDPADFGSSSSPEPTPEIVDVTRGTTGTQVTFPAHLSTTRPWGGVYELSSTSSSGGSSSRSSKHHLHQVAAAAAATAASSSISSSGSKQQHETAAAAGANSKQQL